MHATLPRRSSTSLAALAPRCPSPSSTGEQKRFAAAETKARVTQLDIARAAGVHNTTVSLALRNSPSIPAETRQRIQALAEKLGYCPDPALRALVAYRKGLATNRRTETIAYITHGATKWSWRDNPILEHYFVSAQQKAETCGYRLEHFWLGEPDLSDQRLSNILFHRGITGVLLASDATGRAEPLELDWERLSAVALGHSPLAPALHRVTTDATGNLRLALRQIRAAGYRRVGLVLPRSWDTAVDQGWSVGLVIEQNELPAAARIPTLFHSQPRSAGSETGERLREADDTARLARWLNEFQPDVILGSARFVPDMLANLGAEVGRDLAFADVLHEDASPQWAGIRQNCHRVGEVAVELLIGQLQQNLRGLPSIPTTTLVRGVWCEGASLPPCRVPPWAAAVAPAGAGSGALEPAETAA